MKTKQEKITHAVVYNDRAIVTKSVEIEIDKNDNNYIFKNLPQNVIKQSVRSKGHVDIIILGIDLIDEYLTDYNEEEIKQLENELKELKYNQQNCIYKIANHDFINNFLNNIKFDNVELLEKNNYKKISIENFSALIDFYDKKSDDINEKKLLIEKEKRTIDNKINKLTSDFNRLKSGNSLQKINCKVNFDSGKKQTIDLQISYAVYGAGWRSLYDARLLYKKRKLELTYFAQVKQNTSEDWDDIQISFSTANPQTDAFLPELNSWYIDFFHPPAPKKDSKKRGLKMKVKEEKEEISEEKMCLGTAGIGDAMEMPATIAELDDDLISTEFNKNTFIPSEVETTGLNVTFKALNNLSLKSDGTDKKSVLVNDDFPVKLQYIIIPKLSENAYLQAVVTNNKNYPLLFGKVNVYQDNTYVGESNIETVSSNEKFKLYMGIDKGIYVKYQLLNKFTQKSGLINKNNNVKYKYKITIINYKENEEEINVFEQIPISSDKEIKVKIDEKNIFHDPDKKGILKAVFKLKPKEKKEIDFSYFIEYPKEKIINGI